MRQAPIRPNGLRYLWTDAFGVLLLVSLQKIGDFQTGERELPGEAGEVFVRKPRAADSVGLSRALSLTTRPR
jgi:hypothetical protein